MQSHGPKRVYTPQSLEFWFDRLERDWADAFSAEELEEGRRIYRDGEVRELELTPKDAIIHRRVEKKDEYAVIEWGTEGLAVRSSTTDRSLAHALAVAGLHEIEELVADEISPLPGETKPAVDADPAGNGHGTLNGKDGNAPANGGGNGHGLAPNGHGTATNGHGNGNGQGKLAAGGTLAAGQGDGASGAATGPSRTLVLVFKTKTAGLTFQAFWAEAEGKARVPALGTPAHANGNGHVTSAERAKLIGLAAYARKAHFQYHQETGVYLMESLVEIPNFLKTVLPAWRKLFVIDLDDKAANLLKGTRTVEIEAVAEMVAPASGSAGEAMGSGTATGGAGSGARGMGLDLRWIFRAGERMLTETEVNALLKKGGAPVILPNLGIVSLPTEKWESFRAWRENLEQTQAAGAASPYLVFSLFNDARLKLTLSPEIDAWRQRVLSAPEAPPELPEVLRPYQRRGVEWLAHLCNVGCHGLLADEMGLGKTLQVITLLATRPEADRPSLVVCPASVVPVWREEIARFQPDLAVDVLKTGNDFTKPSNGPVLWLASYTQLRKHRELLAAHEFGYVILDEGQFIKNPDAKVTQACFAIRARHRIVLTGTPLENRQLDLWSIFRFLLPGLLGSRSSFESALLVDRAGTLERLRVQLAPFILRRTKKEVAQELPEKIEMDLLCPLTDVQRAEYARICTEGLQRLGDDVGAAMREKSFGFLALLTRLRQTCCDPDMLPWLKSPLADSGKIALLMEKLAEVVSSGHKVVIFSQFVMFLDRVRAALNERFPELPHFELTGMTLDRLKPVQQFQNAPGAAVMLVSLKAAGTGITLHAADYVFLLDPWWNPAVEAQAVDRVHRIGQTNTVFVYRMVTAGTIEERIQALKEEKRDLFEKLVGGLGGDFDLGQHFTSLRGLVQLTSQVEPEPELAAYTVD
ncbi:DEAD/DEAH box helicase [Opitutus terrae]|uniref:Non-specific serine/threonine protein kinase n=1 Tax=Opitutus terrae (strain DSM 11246 / JCM 15787 / PB90-1) TaxID=452637 RepID=B1ZT34_OPITP|nr:DEAD/DEAH box helicase [Opitutus terrae]ACB75823.1 Non-specific serine/threonine protein kinase [Opitutus terrae PB90-1]